MCARFFSVWKMHCNVIQTRVVRDSNKLSYSATTPAHISLKLVVLFLAFKKRFLPAHFLSVAIRFSDILEQSQSEACEEGRKNGISHTRTSYTRRYYYYFEMVIRAYYFNLPRLCPNHDFLLNSNGKSREILEYWLNLLLLWGVAAALAIAYIQLTGYNDDDDCTLGKLISRESWNFLWSWASS